MSADFLGPYLKLNLLLAVAYVLWPLTRHTARLCGFEVGQARQLAIARALFLGFLLAAPLLWLLGNFIPLFAALAGLAPASFLVGEMSVSAAMDAGLSREYQVGSLSFLLSGLLLALLLAGLCVQAFRFSRQWRHLKSIVEGGLELRSIGSVKLVVSEQIAAPFSTRALGRNHIVLPVRLLSSPRNFRIALKHELQHLRNGDLDWVIFIEALKLLCFWNPAAHAWHDEFDCLQEFACDEVLLEKRKLTRKNYGDCLLAVAATSSRDILPASSNMVPRFSLLRTSQSQLRRRIVMMARIRERKVVFLRTIGYAALFGTGLLASSLLVFAQQEQGERQEYLPLQTVSPKYPKAALKQKLVGWVQLEFTITEEGSVANPRVVDSCVDGPLDSPNDENGCLIEYEGIFNESALTAIEGWRYEPKLENGVPVRASGIQTVFRFKLSD